MDGFGGRLLDGERLIWTGAPAQGILFTASDGLKISFSLLWCAFVFFWEATALRQGRAPFFLKLWGLPFVLMGLYFVVGRFLFDAWLRRGMVYAVTNKRILIARSRPAVRLIAINLDLLPETKLTEGRNGRGTIQFGVAQGIGGRNGFPGWAPALDPVPQFICIEDAASVFDQVQRLAHNRTRAG